MAQNLSSLKLKCFSIEHNEPKQINKYILNLHGILYAIAIYNNLHLLNSQN